MANDYGAAELIGVLIAGAVNGWALISLAQSDMIGGSRFLALTIGGIFAYAAAKITMRILQRVMNPSTSGNAKLSDIFKINDWAHWIIWGGINGMLFFTLLPYVGEGTGMGILLGTGTFFSANVFTYLLGV